MLMLMLRKQAMMWCEASSQAIVTIIIKTSLEVRLFRSKNTFNFPCIIVTFWFYNKLLISSLVIVLLLVSR